MDGAESGFYRYSIGKLNASGVRDTISFVWNPSSTVKDELNKTRSFFLRSPERH